MGVYKDGALKEERNDSNLTEHGHDNKCDVETYEENGIEPVEKEIKLQTPVTSYMNSSH